jgi:hypothetical protein
MGRGELEKIKKETRKEIKKKLRMGKRSKDWKEGRKMNRNKVLSYEGVQIIEETLIKKGHSSI